MPASTPLVELRDVTCGYGDRIILENVNLTVPRGKVLALMGTSGGGKTTVLRLIGRQLQPMKGQVLFDGVDIATLDAQGLHAMRRRMGMLFQFGALFTDLSVFDNVAFPLREHTNLGEAIDTRNAEQLFRLRRRLGMLFQFGALFTDLSVFENVAFPLREHTDLDDAMIRDIVLMKLNAVGLRGAAMLRIAEISGGMGRRVALARAIALDPELLLYDEPFTGLDPIAMGVTANLIRKLNDALGATSLIVSHDVQECFEICDYAYIMAAPGVVIAHGRPDELNASADPQVRQFIRGEPDGPVPFHYPALPLAQDLGLGA